MNNDCGLMKGIDYEKQMIIIRNTDYLRERSFLKVVNNRRKWKKRR